MKNLLDSLLDYNPNTTGVKKHASVLIPIIKVDGTNHLLFERRAFTLKTQPGEICFPGGICEKDETPRETAIRETLEELNITEDKIKILGQIDSILTHFDMLIHCFVAEICLPITDINFSKSEVDHLFSVPIEHFLTHPPLNYTIRTRYEMDNDFPFDSIPEGKGYNFKHSANQVAFYHYQTHTIWGLTARMVQNFINLLKH